MTVTFSGPNNFAAGDRPESVAVGDFNGDGKQDLAVANDSSGDNVSVLVGDGLGGFSPPNNFAAGDRPFSVAVGDFDGDGKQDLAVANDFGDNVSVLLGDGLGGFSPANNFAAGDGPNSVAVGDFNGDGKQDLAVTNFSSDNVSVLLGDGLGGFSGPNNFAAGDGTDFVAVGDFNGDGKQDLAVADYFSDSASVLLGDGLGGFSGPNNFATGQAPQSVAVGDFNGDGKQDLAVGNYNGFSVSVLLGDGLGGFSPANNFAADFPSSVKVGDFNGDGMQDLAVANLGLGAVSVHLGDGLGGFSGPNNFAAGFNPASVAVGDFNGDGKQDLAVANQLSHNVSVLLNTTLADLIATGGQSISPVEGTSSGSVLLATFVDPSGPGALAEYSADIDWGDGTGTQLGAGSISLNGTTFEVRGSHTYAEESASDHPGSNPYQITITVHHLATTPQTVTSTATVSDPAVIATGGQAISSVEGASTGSVLVATFTDPGGPEALADYSADIDWGDGTGTQLGAGSISLNGTTFEVRGSHTYAEESASDHPGSNPYQITITVHHEATAPQTVTSTATVSDPAVIATGGFAFVATEGVLSPVQTVATFTDPGGAEALADYSALIDWGDGTAPSAGTISFAAGTFTVQGSHTFAVGLGLPDDFGDSIKDGLPPSYHKPITVSISHELAPVALATSDAVIAIPQGVAYVTSGYLIVVGTTHDDHVTIAKPAPGSLRVYADFFHNPAFETFPAAGINEIAAFLLLGNDTFIINSNVTTPAVVHGGPGNDLLKAGGGPSVLLGDQGNDRLVGGDDRDIIIGGLGADLLMGGLDEDILIGGTTAYDFKHKALMDLLTEWTSPASYTVRTDRLRNGTGDTGVQLARGVTVFDDFEADQLVGSFGTDWFFLDPLDKTPDRTSNERIN